MSESVADPAHAGAVADSDVIDSSMLLSLRGITKHFGAVQALRNVDLDVPAGQVTALVGDNGAGKSTLIKAIAGINEPSSGTMYWQGEKMNVHTPKEAALLGIATVYQDLALCDNLDIVANMYLGFEATKHEILDEITMEKHTQQTLKDLSVTTVHSVRQLVATLSGGQRQSIAVARAVMRDAKLVIMDEPTAALGLRQTEATARLIKQVAAQSVAVILISHSLEQVFSLADRIISLRLGEVTLDASAKQTTPDEVRALMSGQRRKGERR